MKLFVTGSAGFIGSALTIRLLDRGDHVIGIDNHNNYYDPALKEARLARHANHPNYTHLRIDIADRTAMEKAFADHKPQGVINLAAQAGVRYSIENPMAYVNSNLVGFAHILEGCRQNRVEHLVYASSSSVYGANTTMPFSVHNNVDHPLSLYAASKKANELMAHTYSHLYELPTTGLRFFTVYGPWGRPDMALFIFTKSILADESIRVFNYGKHQRDFTYVDDIATSIEKLLKKIPKKNTPFEIFNIGNSKPIKLQNFIKEIEFNLKIKAKIKYLPLQKGDIPNTNSNSKKLYNKINFKPRTNYKVGIKNFISWYLNYYEKKL